MARRATRDEARYARPGVPPGLALRAPAVRALALSALLLIPTTVTAQTTATARASVRVGTVSQLDVQAYGGETTSATAETSSLRTETLRLHVRANHEWKVVLGVGFDAGPVWVCVEGTSDCERLAPGTDAVVAAGAAGEVVEGLEVRWDASTYPDIASLPMTYTLAAASD